MYPGPTGGLCGERDLIVYGGREESTKHVVIHNGLYASFVEMSPLLWKYVGHPVSWTEPVLCSCPAKGEITQLSLINLGQNPSGLTAFGGRAPMVMRTSHWTCLFRYWREVNSGVALIQLLPVLFFVLRVDSVSWCLSFFRRKSYTERQGLVTV